MYFLDVHKKTSYGSNSKTEQLDTVRHGLYRAAATVNLWTPDDERNGRSKHVDLYKICRINTMVVRKVKNVLPYIDIYW